MQKAKASPLTKYILLAILLLSVAAITLLQGRISLAHQERDSLARDVATLEQQNLELEYRIAELGTDEAVIRLARERLHWVREGEIVYIDDGE